MRTCLFLLLLGIASLGGNGCKPVLRSGPFSHGTFDPQRFVAAGDGYVAGWADGGLYRKAQEGSFPALIAGQLSLSTATAFTQPVVPVTGNGYLRLDQWKTLSACAVASLWTRTTPVTADAAWTVPVFNAGPFHNLGIPGLLPGEIQSVEATLHNPWFIRMEPEPDRFTYAAHAARVPATGFVLWLGLEELARRAASGKVTSRPLPDPVSLAPVFQLLLDSLCKQGDVRGVVGTLPSPGLLPLCAATGTTWLTDNCDPLPVFITTRSGMVRAASGQDRVLLTAAPVLGVPQPGGGSPGLSSLHPLPDSLVLDREELAHLDSLKDLYNAAWKLAAEAVNAKGNHVVTADLEAAFRTLAQTPRAVNGVIISTSHLTGGIFSHDGCSLTLRGNAWVANQFLATLNQHFGASLPLLELGRFQGTKWP